MSWLTLTRWEWFKVRGRRVTWALLAVLVFFSAVFVLIRFADYQFQKDREIVDELIFVPGGAGDRQLRGRGELHPVLGGRAPHVGTRALHAR